MNIEYNVITFTKQWSTLLILLMIWLQYFL